MVDLKLAISQARSSFNEVPNVPKSNVQVWWDGEGKACAYSYSSGRELWVDFLRVSRFYLENREEVKAIPYPNVRTELIQETFRRYVLPMMIQALGTEVLHASAVLAPAGVVAICAHSGGGKSTTAYALSKRDYQLWADDTVAFETSDVAIRTIPLPFEMRLEPDAKKYFDNRQAESFSNSGTRSLNSTHKQSNPLAALIVLNRQSTGSGTNCAESVRRPPAKALKLVLPHAYDFGLSEKERMRMVKHYLGLISMVPIFELRFQAGLERLPTVLDCIEKIIQMVEKDKI